MSHIERNIEEICREPFILPHPLVLLQYLHKMYGKVKASSQKNEFSVTNFGEDVKCVKKSKRPEDR